MVQTLESVDGAQSGVDAEEAHAAGVDGALQRVGELVVPVAVYSHHLDHRRVRGDVFRNRGLVGWLGEHGSIIIVVHHGDVNLQQKDRREGNGIVFYRLGVNFTEE